MGKAMPPAARPTYEQLEEIIRRKDERVRQSYWETEGFRAVAWMAAMAHDSGMVGYSEETYAGVASHVFLFLAGAMREQDDDFRATYSNVESNVLAGLPEREEAAHA